MKNLLTALLLLVAACAAGCTASTSQLQRARALGQWQVEAAFGTTIPISATVFQAAIDAIDTLEPRVQAAEQGTAPLTEAEARELVRAGLSVLLFTPTPLSEFSARLGLGKGFDVGLRFSGPRTALDGKWQFLGAEQAGVDMALSLAVGRHSSPAESLWSKAYDIAEKLKFAGYERTDLTSALLVSRDFGEWASLYGAAVWMRSWISISTVLDEDVVEAGVSTSDLVDPGPFDQIGGVAGVRLGYRYVWVSFELSVTKVAFSPTLIGQGVDLSGWMVSPTIALVGRF
ncbi:MAG: hypothetical protein H6747_10530 [Deltaproteobacteria bacterium]|nr:hypothetical protein [Deltaproteobacteria bacterium]